MSGTKRAGATSESGSKKQHTDADTTSAEIAGLTREEALAKIESTVTAELMAWVLLMTRDEDAAGITKSSTSKDEEAYAKIAVRINRWLAGIVNQEECAISFDSLCESLEKYLGKRHTERCRVRTNAVETARAMRALDYNYDSEVDEFATEYLDDECILADNRARAFGCLVKVRADVRAMQRGETPDTESACSDLEWLATKVWRDDDDDEDSTHWRRLVDRVDAIYPLFNSFA